MYSPLQFAQAPDTTYKINPFISLRILYSKNGFQQMVLQKRDIQAFYGIRTPDFFSRRKAIPLILQIHTESTLLLRSVRDTSFFLHLEIILNS